jgi:DNA-binding IclR family transcriptional regulator
MKSTNPEPGVASVNRALAILQAFENSVEGMSLTEMSAATGLYHSTILRICESLLHHGYLRRLEEGRFKLGPTPFYLGMLYQESFRLWDHASPVLRELVRATGETAAIYIRDGDHRVCLHRMTQPRSVRMHVREGERVELEKGAAGRVILAFSGKRGRTYDQIRQAHYAVSLAERRSETAAIACPVFGVKQSLICSISLGMPLFRFNKKRFDESLPLVMQAGVALSERLGGNAEGLMPPYTASVITPTISS